MGLSYSIYVNEKTNVDFKSLEIIWVIIVRNLMLIIFFI